jgi:hypothetical protein
MDNRDLREQQFRIICVHSRDRVGIAREIGLLEDFVAFGN